MERIAKAALNLLLKNRDQDGRKVKVRIEVHASVVETSSSSFKEPGAFYGLANPSGNQKNVFSGEPSLSLSKNVRKPLPYDVLPHIVAEVITEALHVLSGAKTQRGARRMWWEREIVRCLSQVSSGIRDATKQVVTSSFLIADNNEGWVIKGMEMINAFAASTLMRFTMAFPLTDLALGSVPLFIAYACLRSAVTLRSNTGSQNVHIGIVIKGDERTISCLAKARFFAEQVRPRAVARLLLEEIEKEEQYADGSAKLAKLDAQMCDSIVRRKVVGLLRLTEDERMMNLTNFCGEIRTQLTALELLIPLLSAKDLMTSNINRTLQELLSMPFENDEYDDIHHRAIFIQAQFEKAAPHSYLIPQTETLQFNIGSFW